MSYYEINSKRIVHLHKVPESRGFSALLFVMPFGSFRGKARWIFEWTSIIFVVSKTVKTNARRDDILIFPRSFIFYSHLKMTSERSKRHDFYR